MPGDPRIQQLLEEILDSNRTPEEVCQDCPELLPRVRERLRRLREVEAQVNALFSTPEITPTPREPLDAPPPHFPDYEVEAILGRGGMSVVYKARDRRLNRLVALKMLLAGAYARPEEIERFLRGAEAKATLRHPNIVQVYDVGDLDGLPYSTMEFVEGGTLAQRLSGTPLPADQAAALLATLAGAVQAAHDGGIIHRDLKPANVLLTADGTPKVADFGLSRRLGDEAGLTQSGATLGTPSYMAPEQARGETHAIGPASDVYALGAILYELLTGRPPFRAESAAETMWQVLEEEPVPPSRLNAKVPRDLETICLKCLHKDPQRRYSTAAALAEDLRRFQGGESIAARPVGLPERMGKWVRRRPEVAGLLAATAVVTIALIAGSLWLAVTQSQRRHAVEGDLSDVAELEQQARWNDARGALQRAEARLNGGGADDLLQRLNQARSDLDLVKELDRIHLNRATSAGDLAYYKTRADRLYTAAFENSGLAKAQDPPAIVAKRVNASAVRVALIAALDDWAVCATDKSRRDWLLSIARQTDPDSLVWGDRIRDSASWHDLAALSELAETVPVTGLSVSLLLALGERLRAGGGDATAFLKRVQEEHPADFWANIGLGDALFRTASLEAASYYRAALASRPEAAVAYTALGDSLRVQKRHNEAVGYYRRALEIDPNYARGQTNLGNLLKDTGQIDEAIACYRKALQIDPNYAWAHLDLARALDKAGRWDESLEHYRQFHAANPTIPHVQNILRSDRVRQGRGEEVRRQWKKALELDPPDHAVWFGYAELCLFLGDGAEYRLACRDLLRRFGNTSDPYVAEQTARAVLLAPPPEEELRNAVALAERAAAADPTTHEWVYPYFLFVKGLAEYRQGRFESALSIMNGGAAKVLGPCPRLILAMARYRLGDMQEARKTLADVISTVDWSMTRVRSHDQWLWHVLRREAEGIILPDLPAFMDGKYQPRDNDERLALLGACQFLNRTGAMARLYAEAFAATPSLADDLAAAHRYNAARAAARAGCGHGADATGLGDEERARWREQARAWLRADLAARTLAFDAGSQATRGAVRLALNHWRQDPDLACVRDSNELDRLPAEERTEYITLWSEVAAVLGRTANLTR